MSTILRSNKFLDPQYLNCLRSYWNGRSEKAKNHIIKGISSSSFPDVDLYLYRLWIEILSQERDNVSLEA